MIMGSFDRITTETAHDHETWPGFAAPWSGLEHGLGLGGVLSAAVVGDLAVPERERVVQVHPRGRPAAPRPGPDPRLGEHVGVVAGDRDRGELLDLHGRAELREERSHRV